MKSGDVKTKKRRNGSHSRHRIKSVTKQLLRIMDDENTTNSEASEHAVFSDINWEENLEVDTTSLLEEFAPQTLHRATKTTVKSNDTNDKPKSENNAIQEKAVESVESEICDVESEICDVESASDFHIGLKLLILNYKTNQWVEGVVEEIDSEEEEILVRYEDGCDSPEEWLSMKSKRIKKRKSIQGSVIPTSKESVTKGKITHEVTSPAPSAPEPVVAKVSVPLSSSKSPVLSRRLSQTSKKKMSIKKIKATVKKASFKKSLTLTSKANQRRTLQSNGKVTRRLPIWKSHNKHNSANSTVSPSVVNVGNCKFLEGEKVLAKWSDHRMQKFPAVIKKVCGGGLYDVLFYDGFEKTIVEDNIYKTTEEEMAKYKESKPSEADSFVDVDLTSKHERRQKKRKTFDDFFEEKDFKRPKKGESFDLNRSESFLRASLSRSKPAIQSFSVHSKRVAVGTPKSSLSSKMSPESSPQNSPSGKDPSTSIQETVSKPSVASEMSERSNSVMLKTESKENNPHVELKIDSSIIKTIPKSKSGSQPLEITCHDGAVRKSILIEDNKLPPGWSKHVIAWVENVWACFLFTPDRYAVHSLIELRKYFRLSEGQEPPDGLDFSFPKDSLSDLAESQKDLIPCADYRKWVNKILDERKIMKKVRILPPSRSIGSGGHFGTKRVRTLLPRYRSHSFNQGTTAKNLEGKVWSCPKDDCYKKFRKENLLQMHIKHYHRELSELAGSAPNVVDLALARSSADGIFTSEPVKRSTSKSPMYELPPEKNVDISTSIPEVKGELKMTGGNITQIVGSSSPQGSMHSNSSLQVALQTVNNSIKVLTPTKHTKIKVESEGESKNIDKEINEKIRTPSIFKSASKKQSEHKSIDDNSCSVVSRSFKKKQGMDKQFFADSVNDAFFEEDSKDDGVVLERLQNEEIINCICGFKEEDGLMVQCEICLCWQHGACHGMEKDLDVPERYVCSICLEPLNVRSSQKYSYANHYLTLTKLPRFNYRTCKEDVLRHRERIISKSFELTANLQSIHKMERALTTKINIAQQSDHPKLYLWSTNWDSSKKKQFLPNVKKSTETMDKGRRGPVGEAPIESIDCRLRLLDKIEADQQDMESRLTIIQAQLQALESEDFELGGEEMEGGGDLLLKQAIYMLLRDLTTIATATTLS